MHRLQCIFPCRITAIVQLDCLCQANHRCRIYFVLLIIPVNHARTSDYSVSHNHGYLQPHSQITACWHAHLYSAMYISITSPSALPPTLPHPETRGSAGWARFRLRGEKLLHQAFFMGLEGVEFLGLRRSISSSREERQSAIFCCSAGMEGQC